MQALDMFRDDLVAVYDAVTSLGGTLNEQGCELSPVRILEILLWTEVEPRGGYRRDTPA
jgi:hypothetical protein